MMWLVGVKRGLAVFFLLNFLIFRSLDFFLSFAGQINSAETRFRESIPATHHGNQVLDPRY